jgi:precorrin-6x reductase
MVIAGTLDARDIIFELSRTGVEVLATVTTEYGKELLNNYPIEVLQGKLDCLKMQNIIKQRQVSCVVDASHPFAREASLNAIEACSSAGISYLRFERESLSYEDKNVIKVYSFEEAADTAARIEGNIFLTVGSNNIRIFTDRIPDYKKRLTVRVLPHSVMLAKCEDAGLSADNIIAAKAPFSVEMNIAMLKHCNSCVMITKESGRTGGTMEKLEAALQLGIKTIIVQRPQIEYITKVHTIEEVLRFVCSKLQSP